MQRAIDDAMERMGSLNYTLPRVMQVVNDMNSSARELVKVIQMDPVLTARVLKVSNSAFFGVREPITNLRRATILMGMNTVRNLALATAVQSSFDLRGNCVVTSEDFWKHSVATAVTSNLIAKRSGMPRTAVENSFIIGMLHLLGRALLIQHFPSEFNDVVRIAKRKNKSATEIERMVFGTDHKLIGVRLAKRWKLPDELVDAIEFYDQPEGSELPTTWAASIAASAVKQVPNTGFVGDRHAIEVPPHIYDSLRFNESSLSKLLDENLQVELAKAADFIRGN